MATRNRPVQAVFLDVRDTLGEVDQPGNFLPYRPSSEQLLRAIRNLGLRVGAITNLPDEWEQADAVNVIRSAVLSQDAETGKYVTVGDFIAAEDFVSNKEAGTAKPDAKIYEFAARKLGLEVGACLFIGENLIEVIGARNAGMQAQLKQCPPGRDFAPALVAKIDASAVDSGRQFQALLEHEHLLGERIFACGERIASWIARLLAGWTPKLDQGSWISPPAVTVPEPLEKAMACYVFLLDRFADQVHLRAEEAMLEVAVACGMPPEQGQWVYDQHDQARAYWAALDVAWRRIKRGDSDDRWFALYDFQKTTEVFVYLFKAHAVRENFQTYTRAGNEFSDSDDSLVMNLISHTGPSDITPYVGMVERMEKLLTTPDTSEPTSALRKLSTATAEGLHVHPKALNRIWQNIPSMAFKTGLYDGITSIRDAKEHGNFGVGQFAALDGELIVSDGRFYRARADGSVGLADEADELCFAQLCYYEPQHCWDAPAGLNYNSFGAFLSEKLTFRNSFCAFRVTGVFASVVPTAPPAVTKPYPKFGAVAALRKSFPVSNIRGCMVGYYSPAFEADDGILGYHFHFISDDRRSGGHVASFTLASGRVDATRVNELILTLPTTAAYDQCVLG